MGSLAPPAATMVRRQYPKSMPGSRSIQAARRVERLRPGLRKCADGPRRLVRPCGLDSLPEYLLDGPALGKLVDELVQLADLLHQWILDVFHPDAADARRSR